MYEYGQQTLIVSAVPVIFVTNREKIVFVLHLLGIIDILN